MLQYIINLQKCQVIRQQPFHSYNSWRFTFNPLHFNGTKLRPFEMFHGMSCWTTRRNPQEPTEAGKPQAGADDEGSTHTGMVQNPFSSNSVTCINYQLIQDWTAINEYLLLGTQHSAHHVVRFTAYLKSK